MEVLHFSFQFQFPIAISLQDIPFVMSNRYHSTDGKLQSTSIRPQGYHPTSTTCVPFNVTNLHNYTDVGEQQREAIVVRTTTTTRRTTILTPLPKRMYTTV
ncbi:hypothetical protein DICVIV_13086 [Dictyocaulus viviparus]|uniref:Uncharacterized protein n=1 Tax=Dictyocaulus viviparus TaxID=29172 RepID=A0A0D8XAZ7_DICVI|nr:hypothetical protein DICVIV_13086 [Dictyocaulus viviparus]